MKIQRMQNKIAVVTGAGRGIGFSTALRLAREGATVEILEMNGETAKEAVLKINSDEQVIRSGGSAKYKLCDVTDEPSVKEVFYEVFKVHGKIDILVNNAGITRDNLLFKMTLDEWNSVIDASLTSTFLCIREAQQYMVKANYGRIVNLSSRSALGNRGQTNYSSAKAGIRGLTSTLAIELGPFNITVNAVAPGYIATAMTEQTAKRVGKSVEEHQNIFAEKTPLRRVGQAEEVASVIAFLASDDASYVSGETLSINGGAR